MSAMSIRLSTGSSVQFDVWTLNIEFSVIVQIKASDLDKFFRKMPWTSQQDTPYAVSLTDKCFVAMRCLEQLYIRWQWENTSLCPNNINKQPFFVWQSQQSLWALSTHLQNSREEKLTNTAEEYIVISYHFLFSENDEAVRITGVQPQHRMKKRNERRWNLK